MRTPVILPVDFRLNFTIGKSTAPTEGPTNDTMDSHDEISAPDPSIVFGSVKVVLLRRLHLDRPFFGLVMGRAKD